MKVIYTITALQHSPSRLYGGHVMGWYSHLASALDAVSSNEGSMCESLYDYIVVEEIQEGVFQTAEARQWFKWDDNRWNKCGPPDDAVGTVNFAMG